jgi:4-diphosphocytidyl-2-C-methyl-D-erythritol kinase
MSLTVRVPAKVNAQLAVGGLRDDGFHGLATVFFAVGLYDEVTVTPADDLVVTVSGRDAAAVPADGSNLAAQAARLLGRRYGIPPHVHLHITKDIPVAGGMAGGSADAAAALVACDALWGTSASRAELLGLAGELGSDVPFGLVGGVALGRGRGELLTPVECAGTYHWVFAVAEGGLATPAVYGECDRLRSAAGGCGDDVVPCPEPSGALLAALREGDAAALGKALDNDLQPAALSLRPALARTLRAGAEAGALGSIVSGSGPTCAFLAKDADAAAAVAEGLLASGTCRAVRTATGPVPGATLVAD